MAPASLIYSVLTHEELARLRSYCSKKDKHRRRGFLQGALSIGRDLYAGLPDITFQKQDIKNETLWFFDSRALKDVDHYTFYRWGIIIRPVESQHQHFNTSTQATGELIIECDRYKFECFFQFLKAFSMGYWGGCLLFQPAVCPLDLYP